MRKSFPPCTQGCARALLASHGRRATAGSSGGNVQRLANLLTPTTLTRSHAPRSARHPTQVSAEAQALAEAQAPAEAPALAEASALATAQTLPAHTPVECCAWRSRLTRRSSVAHGAPGSHAGRVLRMALPAHTPVECCAKTLSTACAPEIAQDDEHTRSGTQGKPRTVPKGEASVGNW
jgi:hypothetical protein